MEFETVMCYLSSR